MQIDYLSDLHLDFYLEVDNRLKDEDIFRLFNPIITENNRQVGKVLIIAGDISHYNFLSIRVLKYLKKHYYQHVVCVLGNHDYYLSDYDQQLQFKNSFKRVENMRKLINQEQGLYCLNGDVVEIDGVRFGGADSWYNHGYIERYKQGQNYTHEAINQVWKQSINDFYSLKGIDNFDDIYKIELPKIKSVYKKCDVMVTHVSPSTKDEHFAHHFRGKVTNTFFSFSGEEFLKETTAKFWVYGHNHELNDFEAYYGIKCVVNGLGYPGESNYVVMKSFNI